MTEMARFAFSRRAEVFSFWWGSPANLLEREPAEVRTIVQSLGGWLTGECPALLRDTGADFRIVGRWQEICPELEPGVEAARAAAQTGGPTLVVLMAYDGRDEIAAASAASSGGGRAGIESLLWTAGLPPVDLVVRTGGTTHLSAGFMLWHIAEAELHFSEKPWPDFTVEDLGAAIARYSTSERRFGR